MKRLTGTAIINTAEGTRIAFTYSEIDDNTGEIIKDNQKASFIALDEQFIKDVKKVQEYITNTKLK